MSKGVDERILIVTHSHVIKSVFRPDYATETGEKEDTIEPANSQLFVCDEDFVINM